MSLERVQKILAQTGITSRRKAEEMIREGRVTINGKAAQLGDRADLSKDAIKVDGKLLQLRDKEAHVYVAFNKPRGVISMFADPQGRPHLGDYLAEMHTRLFPVGRLDFLSEGLLLLTNDGELAEKIQKSDKIPRVYWVRVKGHPEAELIEKLKKGGRIEGQLIKPHSVRLAGDHSSRSKIEVVMVGNGSADLQGLFEQKGFLADKIVRQAVGHVALGTLKPGEFRMLKKSQFEAVFEQTELALQRIDQETERTREWAVKIDARHKAQRERAELEEFGPAQDEESGDAKPARGSKKVISPVGAARPRRTPDGEGRDSRAPRSFSNDRDSGASRGFSRDRDGDRRGSFGRVSSGEGRGERSFARDRDRGQGFGQGGMGRWSEERSERPSRGGFGKPRGERSGSFSKDRDERPSRGGFGKPRGERSGSFSKDRDERPSRGGFGKPRAERSGSFSKDRDERPSRGGFGKPRSSSSWGGERSSGGAGFGKDRGERSSGFSKDRGERSERPSFPKRSSRSDGDYGLAADPRPRRPGFGKQPRTGGASSGSDRPTRGGPRGGSSGGGGGKGFGRGPKRR